MRCERLCRRSPGLIACIAATTIVGCASAPQRTEQIQTAPAATLAQQRDPVLDLLEYARHLREATPEARARAVVDARNRVHNTPGAIGYARLALAYGTPGQRRYTPDEAARYAKRALDVDDTPWSPAAGQYLSDIARLYTESARQAQPAPTGTANRGQPSADPTPQRRANNQSIVNTRVRALEKQLDEANRKLRELADIEEHLNEPGS